MKTTMNNREILTTYKNLKGDDYISRYEQHHFAAPLFNSYLEEYNTNEIKDFKVLDRYKNVIDVRVIGRGSKSDIQLYVVKHKNYNARKFKTECKIYTSQEIAKLNLKRL